MYKDLFGQMKKQLTQMSTWFDAAAAHATAKKFDVNTLLQSRLAPDQLALSSQVQIACDTAKLGLSRITGKEATSQPDTEKTVDELRARIAFVIAYLDSATDADFASVAQRTVTQPRWEGKTMKAHDYLLEHVLPNFYFHTVHTYAILRHNGVNVGKRDYLGALTQSPAAPAA